MSLVSDHIVTTAGHVFSISADNGDIRANTLHGLYAYDTRFLSTFELIIDGHHCRSLRAGAVTAGRASFSALTTADVAEAGSLTVIRDRRVEDGLSETITLFNHTAKPRAVRVELIFDTDFADIFEVRRANAPWQRRLELRHEQDGGFSLCYRRGEYRRETRLACSPHPEWTAAEHGAKACHAITIAPHASWTLEIAALPAMTRSSNSEQLHKQALPKRVRRGDNAGPLADIPHLDTQDLNLRQAWDQAVKDLHDLIIEPITGRFLLAAGMPWFMTVFGRDSIIAALEVKLLSSRFLVDTLAVLAYYQAETVDSFREAEPGKIPHEIRYGELSEFEDVPHSRYYGSVDATPLFPILLHEAYAWSGDIGIVQQFLPAAERALAWIDQYGDPNGDGFIEYPGMAQQQGLANQGWKDSGDAIAFADGRQAEGPIAVAEVQGYVYRALLDMAALYRQMDRLDRAAELEQRADRLKARFNEAFWMPEHEYYAIALDGHEQPVDAISSNIGHCLWSGIVDKDKASAVAGRLMSEELFSGWGIRTLSEQMASYHPLSYHNGSVWPHDTVIAAAGLMGYGFKHEARVIINGLLQAAAAMPDHRLPELFAGYPRSLAPFPIPYPLANAPQAWAAGSVIYAVELLLSLRADGDSLVSDLPPASRPAGLHGVFYRGRRWDF